jgi:hypothetical protein
MFRILSTMIFISLDNDKGIAHDFKKFGGFFHFIYVILFIFDMFRAQKSLG